MCTIMHQEGKNWYIPKFGFLVDFNFLVQYNSPDVIILVSMIHNSLQNVLTENFCVVFNISHFFSFQRSMREIEDYSK